MKKPKFLAAIRTVIADKCIGKEAGDTLLTGADLALRLVAEHYQATPLLNPAQVGYKRITPIHINYQAQLQKLANELAHEKEAHQRAIDTLRSLKEALGPNALEEMRRLKGELKSAKSDLALLTNQPGLSAKATKRSAAVRLAHCQQENARLVAGLKELEAHA